MHSPAQLAAVATELNDRPRKTLGWGTATARLGEWLPADAGHDSDTSQWALPPCGLRRCEDAAMATFADVARNHHVGTANVLLDQIPPEPPDNTAATVTGCWTH